MCISTLRLIRSAHEAPTKEVLTEYFRLIGCLFCDRPVYSVLEAENELKEEDGAEVDIVLNIDSERFRVEELLSEPEIEKKEDGSFWAIKTVRIENRKKPVVFVNFEIPSQDKKNFYQGLIQKLVAQIWSAGGEQTEIQRRQLQEINRLYFELDLLGFLQCKRAFRVLKMGEVLEIRLGRQSIPASAYIGKMLLAFDAFYQELSEIKKNDQEPASVYVRYARVNIARKIREVFSLLEGVPAFEKESDEPQSVTYCSASFLLSELGELYKQDQKYLGTLFLAAYVCQGEPSQMLNAGFYYQQLFEELEHGSRKLYSFAYYEYGRYVEKTERNWDRAILYYKKAVELDPRCYQAWFKVACREAILGNFEAAKDGFRKVIYIIGVEFSGSQEIKWENLSLKSTQYIFKAYMRLWEIAMAEKNYSAATVHLRQAQMIAEKYKENKCLERVYDTDSLEWDALKKYHEDSRPVRILQEVVNDKLLSNNKG